MSLDNIREAGRRLTRDIPVARPRACFACPVLLQTKRSNPLTPTNNLLAPITMDLLVSYQGDRFYPTPVPVVRELSSVNHRLAGTE